MYHAQFPDQMVKGQGHIGRSKFMQSMTPYMFDSHVICGRNAARYGMLCRASIGFQNIKVIQVVRRVCSANPVFMCLCDWFASYDTDITNEETMCRVPHLGQKVKYQD